MPPAGAAPQKNGARGRRFLLELELYFFFGVAMGGSHTTLATVPGPNQMTYGS